MPIRGKIANAFVVPALLLAVLASCREARRSGAVPLQVISPHPETLLEEFEHAFQTWYHKQTGGGEVDCIWLDHGGTSKMLRVIYSEFDRKPDGIGIDVVWGGGTDPYLQMASRNLLQSYKLPEPILSKIPAERYGLRIYDPRYRWYGCWLTGFGIIYNRRVLALQGLRVPETWADLTDPSYFSWVGSADPRQSGSAHMAYEILLQAYGWEKGWEVITLMGANIKAFTRLSSDVPRDAALGEVACGLCIDTFAYSQMAFTGRDILGYVMPEGLTVLNPDGIGILKGAPQEAAAKKLIEFVMSEEGQRLIMLAPGRPGGPRRFGISRMSVHPDLYEQLGKDCSVPVNPFRMKSSLQFDTDKAARRYKLLDDMVGSLVIDNHALLQSAWAAVSRTKPPRREELARRLGRPPVDEGKAMDFAANAWSDTIARNRALLEWSRFAREKYEAVLRETR